MNTKKTAGILVLLVGMVLISTSAFAQWEDDRLCREAQELAKKAYYHNAYETYERARKRFLEIGDTEKADACRIEMQQIQKIFVDYPYTREDAVRLLEENFKHISEDERNSWIEKGRVDFIMSDGEPLYFAAFVANLRYRNPQFVQKEKLIEGTRRVFAKYQDLVCRYPGSGYPAQTWKPYINPVVFLVSASLSIPRGELPETGLFELWIPLPIQTAAQRNVRVISIVPEEYVTIPPRVDGDIGLAYLKIPLEQLKEDLNIRLRFSFSHYEQRFIIDPENVGEYDEESYLYRKYTRSYGNTTITPEIRQKAQEIAGDEKNPYLAAKRIYDYIVEDIDYSAMPELSLNVLGKPESVYVHEHSYGDCGAQSAYFCALCRSLGIPARSTGGMQLCPGQEGAHFWAEFYLPNYGWIPVDTSVAQMANRPGLTNSQRKRFTEFFFGSQDPYRYVIQKDLDVPLNPEPDEPVLLPEAIQFPAVVCKTSTPRLWQSLYSSYWQELGTSALGKHWNIEFEPVYR